MRNFYEVVESRRSIRKFKPDAIPLADLKEIVRIGTLAPSASNKQMWKFIVITNRVVLNRMCDVVTAKYEALALETQPHGVDSLVQSMKPYATFFNNAPALIVVLQEPYRGRLDNALLTAGYDAVELMKKHGYGGPQSIGAAIQNICLAVEAKGYGTCWMCAPLIAQSELCSVLEIETPWSIAALLPIGISDEAPEPRPRKPFEEICTIIE